MSTPPTLSGIHHIRLPVSSIEQTFPFYQDILGLKHIAACDHINKQGERFAVILESNHRGVPMLVELRRNPEQAAKQVYTNPIVWAVSKRSDLDVWKGWLEKQDVKCSKVLTGIKVWVLCALDPDEKMVRLYCDESHEMTTDYDVDEFWLRD
ncbi:hypothetical protein M409DRAFT_26110 [Zasmidium cellare ATCC 36951]|uniref:VOC domain-containing protein n=1 Tax=Zasmidium cellare ATCC 36951 TaxID=1080233 RepID=A0A6A6CCS9_ZASCE|nr:uncharacterized protein M409DRAFT_26110 [Zasmidium cellare ATCC 36951]KAF2163499.1 hypothetical protein M409DRAFT_26110 [Zasmidium cellare ATCC 36951]